MLAYKFRIWIVDDELTVYRDVLASSQNTLKELQECLLQAFDFDHRHESACHLTNTEWRITQSINKKQWAELPLERLIQDPFQHLLLEYDPSKNWEFKIRLLEVENSVESSYPKCCYQHGIAPPQYTPEEFAALQSQLSIEEQIRYKSSIRF